VLIIERDFALGGILRQCIHDGFGIVKFRKRLTGGQYAQHYINEVAEKHIDVKLNTMVLEITPERTVYAVNEEEGILKIHTKAVVLAMGCRERTRSQVFILGTRPAGVLTAGAVQRYINIDGYLPGKKAVILGSGDIGLLMARRMTLEKIAVEGIYEMMPSPGGLTRNVEQCLKDYNVPLHLSTTVTKIHGKDRVEGVTVAKVDKDLKPIKGTERYVDCDLLVLSVGLIPENELSEKAGVEIDPRTKGPIVDQSMMTSIDGVFAAGNVVTVFDLVDYVSLTGEIAGKGAADYIRDGGTKRSYIDITNGDNALFVVPQRINKNTDKETVDVFMRVKNTEEDVTVYLQNDGERVKIRKEVVVRPPEMVVCKIKLEQIKKAGSHTTIDIRKG
jgi:NADPH-dependent 2,4-dienoyl-CoA reductase/sulfur reductase-like enzyme